MFLRSVRRLVTQSNTLVFVFLGLLVCGTAQAQTVNAVYYDFIVTGGVVSQSASTGDSAYKNGSYTYSFDQQFISYDQGNSLSAYGVGTFSITSATGSASFLSGQSSNITTVNGASGYTVLQVDGNGNPLLSIGLRNAGYFDTSVAAFNFKLPTIDAPPRTGGAVYSLLDGGQDGSYTVGVTMRTWVNNVVGIDYNNNATSLNNPFGGALNASPGALVITNIVYAPEMANELWPQILMFLVGLFLILRRQSTRSII